MAKTLVITLTSTGGPDTGPFNVIAINSSGAQTLVGSNVDGVVLTAGYTSAIVPDDAVTIRVQSNNTYCTNFVDLEIK